MFKKILVPTDLTEKSKNALDIAVSMAAKYGGKVTLLHVIERIDNAEEAEFADFYEKLKTRAGKGLEEMVQEYMEGSVPIDSEILIGKRVPEIVGYSDENEMDLIILSSHRIDDFSSGEGWATISYKAAILAMCPVMMVK